MGGASGLALVSNAGTVVTQLPTPGLSGCQLARWWAAGVALASCSQSQTPPQLWEIPISGGTPIALTATPVSPDNGDLNAWQTPSGVYVQAAGGCGYQYLAKLAANATTAPVAVPDVNSGDSQFVLGTTGNLIALQASVACGPGESALWYDAASNTATVVLGPPINGGSVTGALSYPDPNG
jgi:TolB protein